MGLEIADLHPNTVVPHELVNTVNATSFTEILNITMYLAITADTTRFEPGMLDKS